VTLEGPAGRISFPIGECSAHVANNVLTLTLAAPDAERMAQLQDVVARHLLRFAFREDLAVAWQTAEAEGPAA